MVIRYIETLFQVESVINAYSDGDIVIIPIL
jgi:hypothetical protein